MGHLINHANIGEVQKTAYLTAKITSVDSENDTVDFIGVGTCPNGSAIPLFYHCETDSALRSNGALEGAAGAFSEDDEVIVQCEIIGANQYKALRVMGFTDKPKVCGVETVYVVMKVGDTERCFVWKIEDGEYEAINDNEGSPASFPCDPADISNWRNNQESVGDALLTANDCGRGFFGYGELPACESGDYGTGGSTSDSKTEPSDCEGCDFTDTAECSISWSLATKCYWNPGNPEDWVYSGSISKHLEQNLLWGRDVGSPPVHYGSRRVEFRNNSEVKDAFRVEIESENDKSEYWSDGGGGGSGCFNLRLDSSNIIATYKFHTPIATNILQIIYTETGSANHFEDTGIRNQENYVFPTMQLKVYGAYSEKIIAQAYFVEVRTVTRSANCNFVAGQCRGSGCAPGGGCPWAEETFTCHGLSVVAQADVLDETDGIDPTGLPRNNPFEDAITELYDVLRVEESVPADEIAGARLTALYILKG